MFCFRLNFGERTTHWCSVVVHSSRSVMRGCLTKRGHDSKNSNAVCWQAHKPASDGCVAEIHLHEKVSINTIIHECCHAAIHRAKLAGLPPGDDMYQEWICEDTELLTNGVINFFKKHQLNPKWDRKLI